MNEKHLALRKKISAKRPAFRPVDSHRRKRLNSRSWRKPKGMHGKQRHNIHCKPANVSYGYRGPKSVRGLDPSGLEPVAVYNIAVLGSINTKTQGALIGSIGNRKKLTILQACKAQGITVLNVKNVDEAISAIEDNLTARKDAKKKTKAAKEEKTKAVKKKAKKEEKQDPEDVREEQQQEMQDIVTSR